MLSTRFALPLALPRLAFALAVGLGALTACREEGSVKPLQGSAGVAAANVGQQGDITLGKILFAVIRDGYADDPAKAAELAVLDARKDDVVAALDAIVPPEVRGNLRGTLADVTRLVRDGTLPALAEAVAEVLDLVVHDPSDPQDTRLEALAALARSKSALDRATITRLISRLFAYPEVEPFVASVVALVRANDGLTASGQPTGLERDLLEELLALLARRLQATEVPAPASASAPTDRLIETLLTPIDLRGQGAGGPAWTVRVDKHGNAKVRPLSSGALPAPFVDRDGDGVADVDAEGLPIDAHGRVIELAAFGEGGARDSYGRAITTSGRTIYEYVNAKATPLGQVLRLAGDLVRAEVPFALARAADRLAPRVTQIDAAGRARFAYTADSPLCDLAWSGLELFRYRDAPKLLDAFAALIRSDPTKAEELLVKVVEAVDILRHTPSLPDQGATTRSLLDDMQPLLDRAFAVNAQTGRSAARLMLQTFTAEQARLRNLPQGFARMMRYSDWMTRTPVGPGQVSMFERLLDMMAEADQCDSWPFGNMATFYLECMTGQKQILGITLSVHTINTLIDIPFLRNLLCPRIQETNVRALHAFAQSGALDALLPIVRAFHQAGEIVTLKRIFLALQSTYRTQMRPHEPALIRVLESGAVERVFEVLDDMNRVRVPGTLEPVSEVVADFLEAVLDGDRVVRDRRGVQHRSLLHLVLAPLDDLAARAGTDPALDQAMASTFDLVLQTTTLSSGRRVLAHHGLIPVAAALLERAAASFSPFPWVRSADVTRYQQDALALLTGPDVPVLVDVLLAIDRAPQRADILRATVNLLTPHQNRAHDAFASVLEVLAAALQDRQDPRARAQAMRFLGRALDPARATGRSLAGGLLALVEGPSGPTLLQVLKNAVNRGAAGDVPSPLEAVLDIFAEVGAAAPSSGPATPATIRAAAADTAAFIRDRTSGLGRIFDNLRRAAP